MTHTHPNHTCACHQHQMVCTSNLTMHPCITLVSLHLFITCISSSLHHISYLCIRFDKYLSNTTFSPHINHIHTSTHQYINTSTHPHINTSTHQRINTSFMHTHPLTASSIRSSFPTTSTSNNVLHSQ